jgi:hypothetical protein
MYEKWKSSNVRSIVGIGAESVLMRNTSRRKLLYRLLKLLAMPLHSIWVGEFLQVMLGWPSITAVDIGPYLFRAIPRYGKFAKKKNFNKCTNGPELFMKRPLTLFIHLRLNQSIGEQPGKNMVFNHGGFSLYYGG